MANMARVTNLAKILMRCSKGSSDSSNFNAKGKIDEFGENLPKGLAKLLMQVILKGEIYTFIENSNVV